MPPKDFETNIGFLYDENGNCLGSFENITNVEEIECEIKDDNDIVRKFNDIGCTSFSFNIDSFGFLTKKQNHLYKYGKYRVRKKYMNKASKTLIKILKGLK